MPDLRFPEFVNEDEWKEKTLGEVGKFIGGGTPDTTNKDYWNGDILWFTPTEVKEGKLIDSRRKITKEGLENSSAKLLPIGTLLITSRATIGDVGIATIPCTTNQGFQSLVVNENQNNVFWYYWLASNKNELIKRSSGSTFPEIGKNEIIQITALVPTKPEQQKIASCLSSLDEVIEAHSQKLELLKDHKKGLMQNLFPKEGDKVSNYRFEGFKGEWEEKKLGDVATFINGRAYKQEELLDSGKYRVLRVGNFFTNNNWYYSDLELEEGKYCDDGDLLYSWSASFGPRIWKGEKVIYHYHIWKVILNKSIDKDFLFILLDNETERMKTQNANGFALLHITKGTIENWKCCIPKSKEEQQKIASCLSALDELITAQAEKIEQLKQHKKGLMQGLFPKMND